MLETRQVFLLLNLMEYKTLLFKCDECKVIIIVNYYSKTRVQSTMSDSKNSKNSRHEECYEKLRQEDRVRKALQSFITHCCDVVACNPDSGDDDDTVSCSFLEFHKFFTMFCDSLNMDIEEVHKNLWVSNRMFDSLGIRVVETNRHSREIGKNEMCKYIYGLKIHASSFMSTPPTQLKQQGPFDTVVYHADCPDGLAAAWAASMAVCGGDINDEKEKNYSSSPSSRLEFIPCAHKKWTDAEANKLLNQLRGARVVVLDFSFPASVMKALVAVTKSILILDHHKSAERELVDFTDFCVFDMDRSGAQIAWDHFHPGKKRPIFIDYIADRDLYTWKIPNSREMCLAFDTEYLGNTEAEAFFGFGRLLAHETLHGSLDRIVEMGKHFLQYHNSLVASYVKKAKRTIFSGKFTVYLVECNSPRLAGDVANRLAQTYVCSFAAAYRYKEEKDLFTFSLRAVPESGVDLSIVTKTFGGGGHPCAAGMAIDGSQQKLSDVFVPFPIKQ